MAGSSTNVGYGYPRKPPLPLFAASDIFAGAPVKFVAPVSGSASSGLFVQQVGSSNDKPVGVAYSDAAAGEPIALLDRLEWPRVACGGSVQPGEYAGVVGASSAIHPVSGVTGSFPTLGRIAGASEVGTWAIGVALEAAVPAGAQKFAVYIDPIQLSTSNKYAGVLG